jgi:hypothetical protein
MSHADFEKGKMCCDKPLFEDYEFECETCASELKPSDKHADTHLRCEDCSALFSCASCAVGLRRRHARYCAPCFGKRDISDAWSDSSSETSSDSESEDEESEDEETPDQWFDRKYPNASCRRCDTKLNARTVVMCGGGGGECETWYCEKCHAEGTHDCEVCAHFAHE